MSFYLAEPEGLDLLCGGGQVAALRAHRALIHYRSRSNPPFPNLFPKNKRAVLSNSSDVVGVTGFEPVASWTRKPSKGVALRLHTLPIDISIDVPTIFCSCIIAHFPPFFKKKQQILKLWT